MTSLAEMESYIANITNLTKLESSIAKGEAYLEDNPSDDYAHTVYWKYIERYVSLTTPRLAVTLELPPNVRWSRDGKSQHHTVEVLLQGVPQTDSEMTKDDLAALLETVQLVKEKREKE